MNPNKLYQAGQPPQMLLFERPSTNIAVLKKPKKTDRVNRGRATNDLILSAYQAPNEIVFPSILELYVSHGAKIADITYGKGVFWRRVDKSKYDLHASDLRCEGIPNECLPGVDSRRLPYEDNSFDCVVFDPPYMHTPGGTAHNGHQNFEGYYANNAEQDREAASELAGETGNVLPKYHEAVLDLYFRSGREAWRVLRGGGTFIVKCQDEVCTNRQRLTHIEITNEYERYGFTVEDLFVVVRNSKPGVSRIMARQYHARKNHSYFMIYRKPREKKGRKTSRRGEI